MFVDSMQVSLSNGYTSPGLDALMKELGMESMGYSAFDDASIFMAECNKKQNL